MLPIYFNVFAICGVVAHKKGERFQGKNAIPEENSDV